MDIARSCLWSPCWRAWRIARWLLCSRRSTRPPRRSARPYRRWPCAPRSRQRWDAPRGKATIRGRGIRPTAGGGIDAGRSTTAQAVHGRPLVHNRALQLADSWRDDGARGRPGRVHGLGDRSRWLRAHRAQPTSVISCRCQVWLYRRWPWGGRSLWTIMVSVRPAHPAADVAAPRHRRPGRRVLPPPGSTTPPGKSCRPGFTAPPPLSPTLADALLTLQ